MKRVLRIWGPIAVISINDIYALYSHFILTHSLTYDLFLSPSQTNTHKTTQLRKYNEHASVSKENNCDL